MNTKLRWYPNNILQTYLDVSFILLKMTLIEEKRAIYYPYIFSIVRTCLYASLEYLRFLRDYNYVVAQ